MKRREKRSWLAAREFAKRSPRNIIRPIPEGSRDPALLPFGGILVLANDTRSSPRPCEKFRTKHNSNRFLPPTKPYFGFSFERYFSADDQRATGACRAGPNNSWGKKRKLL